MDYTQLSDTELQEAINFHRRQRNMSRGINESASMRQTQIVRLLEAEEARRLDEISAEKKMAYGKAAFADYHKQSKAKLGKILSGDKDTSGESRKIANRLKGISTASKTEETELDEGISNLSDARLKFHVLKDVPHGSYTKKEMAAEHLRRKKAGGPAYNAVKPSLNEESDLEEAKTDVYHKHMLKALGKSRLPKDHPYTSSIATNGDFVVRKGSEIAGRIPKGEHNLKEETMTPTDMKQREKIVKGMKKSAQDFKDRYGSKWKSVMYATATKAAMKEEVELGEANTPGWSFKVTTRKHGQHDVKVARSAAKSVDDAEQYIKKHPMYVKHKPTKIEYVKEEVEQIDEKITEVSMKQLQKKFNDGTHEAMNDPKPGSHVELRNTKTGKRTTHYVKEEVELDEATYHVSYGKGLEKDFVANSENDAHEKAMAHFKKTKPKLNDPKYSDVFSKKSINRITGNEPRVKNEEVELDEAESWEAGYDRRVVKTTKPEHKEKGYNWRIKGKERPEISIRLYKEKPSQEEFNKQMKRVAGHEFGG